MKYTPKVAINPNIDSRPATGHLWILVRLTLIVILTYLALVYGAGWVGRRIPVRFEVIAFRRIFGTFVPGIQSSDPRYVVAVKAFERVRAVSSLKSETLDFRVMESSEENAYALPGGIVVVNTALIENAKSENELAMVIGHELGHIANRDVMSGLGRALLMALSAAVFDSTDKSAAIAESGTLLSMAYSRSQETSADSFGLHLLVSAYGGAAGAADFFERHLEEDKDGGSLFSRSHPLSAERIRQLMSLAGEMKASTNNKKLTIALKH